MTGRENTSRGLNNLVGIQTSWCYIHNKLGGTVKRQNTHHADQHYPPLYPLSTCSTSLPYFFSEAVQSKSKYLTGAPGHGLINFATEERTAFHRNSCTCSGNTEQLTCTTHRIQPIGRCWCMAHTAGASKGKGACFQHYPLEFTFPASTEWYTQSQWRLKWCGHEALVKEHAFQRRITYSDEAVQFTMPVCCQELLHNVSYEMQSCMYVHIVPSQVNYSTKHFNNRHYTSHSQNLYWNASLQTACEPVSCQCYLDNDF